MSTPRECCSFHRLLDQRKAVIVPCDPFARIVQVNPHECNDAAYEAPPDVPETLSERNPALARALEGGRQTVRAAQEFHAERDARVLALLKSIQSRGIDGAPDPELDSELAALMRELSGER